MAVQAASRFQKPVVGQQAAVVQTQQDPQKPWSRYSGVKARKAFPEFPNVGTYILRVVSCIEEPSQKSKEMGFRADLEIVEILEGGAGHRVGEVVRFRETTSGRSATFGCRTVKEFVMNASGIPDEASYDEFDPDGYFIDLVGGTVHPGNEQYRKNGDSIVGQLIRAKVTKGADRKDGDWYRNWSFSVVEDAPAAA